MVKPYLTLCRVYISLFAACSAATGFFLGPSCRFADAVVPVAAVFFLASGASALNQYQERNSDSLMERTCRRPIPSGVITPLSAVSISLMLMLAGLLLLVTAPEGTKTGMLGLFAILWYNGVYTTLKKITAYAAVPGALVGAIPPAIGWTSAGGAVFDTRLAAIGFTFFIWQVSHFWLLLLRHGDEYAKAGLPSLSTEMSKAQIARVAFVWISAAAVAGLALPMYGIGGSPVVRYSLVALAAWLIWNERALSGNSSLLSPSSVLFKKLNLYLCLTMFLLSLGNIFFRIP